MRNKIILTALLLVSIVTATHTLIKVQVFSEGTQCPANAYNCKLEVYRNGIKISTLTIPKNATVDIKMSVFYKNTTTTTTLPGGTTTTSTTLGTTTTTTLPVEPLINVSTSVVNDTLFIRNDWNETIDVYYGIYNTNAACIDGVTCRGAPKLATLNVSEETNTTVNFNNTLVVTESPMDISMPPVIIPY